MKKLLLSVILALSLALAACPKPPPPASGPSKEEVRARHEGSQQELSGEEDARQSEAE